MIKTASQAAEISRLASRIKRYDEFLHATDDLFQEYLNWKRETDLIHISIDGMRLKIQYIVFTQWLEWRLQNELQEQAAQITEDIDFTIC